MRFGRKRSSRADSEDLTRAANSSAEAFALELNFIPKLIKLSGDKILLRVIWGLEGRERNAR